MALDLSILSNLHRNQLESEFPWIWLYEIQTPDDPPQRYRLTNFTEQVAYGENKAGERLIYSPAPIVHGDVDEGTDGSLPTMGVTLGNAGPIMASTIDGADGYVGLPIRMTLVSSLELSNPDAGIVQDGEIVSASIQSNAIGIKVSPFNLYQLQFPPYIFSRRRCRLIFGSDRCGYNVLAVGAGFSTCPRLLEACEERGDDEVARGLARLHPSRFGGWKGIGRSIS